MMKMGMAIDSSSILDHQAQVIHYESEKMCPLHEFVKLSFESTHDVLLKTECFLFE